MDGPTRLQITSEIYSETDFRSCNTKNGTSISQFTFRYPNDANSEQNDETKSIKIDDDGDLIVSRKRTNSIRIEHKRSTELPLVGLQVWRGALVLADFLFFKRKFFLNKNLLELGSGVGLTSIAAAIHSTQNIICTDIDLGGLLDIIRSNIQINKQIMNNQATIDVMELDFTQRNWSNNLKMAVTNANIIIAADVIYDNDITDEFVQTLKQMLDINSYNRQRDKEVYIALEKRYVFTLADLDTTAPCYEYFLQCINDLQTNFKWKIERVPIDFPQYFNYERSKELVLLKLYV